VSSLSITERRIKRRMNCYCCVLFCLWAHAIAGGRGQQHFERSDQLGTVSFPISCVPATRTASTIASYCLTASCAAFITAYQIARLPFVDSVTKLRSRRLAFHNATLLPNPTDCYSGSFSDHAKSGRRAYCGAPALLASNLRPRRITLCQSQNCDLPRKQNGLVDRLRHLTAQTFASDVVGAEMLPSVNPAQSRLLRRR
jgi:hypothetical protein